MNLSQVLRRITNLIEERNINVSKLSTMAGISRSTLSKFLAGKRKILRLNMIEYICEGLNIKLQDFINKMVVFLMGIVALDLCLLPKNEKACSSLSLR